MFLVGTWLRFRVFGCLDLYALHKLRLKQSSGYWPDHNADKDVDAVVETSQVPKRLPEA